MIDAEDAASIGMKLEDGAIGSIFLSEVSHGRKNRLSIEITGYNRSLWWNREDNNKINIAENSGHSYEELFAFQSKVKGV